MKTIIKSFLLAALLCFANNFLSAQEKEAPTAYHAISYMKVEPGNHSDYLKCEKAWKKIHAAKKEAGKLNNWALSRVISPSGSHVEYNYVTRNSFRGEDQFANYFEGSYMPDNWTSLLTVDEIDLVMRTGELRTIVKTEVWSNAEVELAEDYRDAKIHVFNYFDYPEGKTRADHFRVERDIWMPVHKARIEAGALKGWVLLRKVMPGGSGMPYHDATVDIYADMKALLTDPVPDYFGKIHEGKDMDKLMNETWENTDLVRREVRMNLDRLDWE